ncbi:MAG TPA: class I SAM-dependent methyltransferase [Ktedonobacteraceae bacterium]|nr:class I SAM-dependent methyltransferase [Ktedonobacteraceae bacterium]
MGLFPWSRRRKPTRTATRWEPTYPRQSVVNDGRRHLQGVTYILPKDLPEANRLDFQHHLLHAILKGNYVAPLGNQVTSILDVATGTGRWAREMAQAFPSAQVIGLDMDVPHRGSYVVPPNYQFVQGNIFAGLPFSDKSFTFVHQRFLVLGLSAKQWPFVVGELVRVTRPGGYVELVEGGGTFYQIGDATGQLQQWWSVASQANGIDVFLMARLPQLLQQAGLHHIRHRTYHVPVGAWGGRVGEMLKQDILASLPGIRAFVCTHASISLEAFDATVAALPGEWERCRTVYEYYLAYGQREP